MTAAQYLATFINHEKNLKEFSARQMHLQRVRLVLAALGSPETRLKVIHIAGSKGKGSTAAFTASILREAGFKVGLYTSPHLYNLRERIRVLAPKQNVPSSPKEIFPDCIPEAELSKLIRKIRPQLEAGRNYRRYGALTYFEVLTIVALCYFKEQAVDWVVLETGLGGRLDATNVCEAVVSVITPISLEHTQQLGTTLAKIATEKAAIIKSPHSVAIIAPQPFDALQVIRKRCRDIGAKTIFVKKNASCSSSLPGRHQKVNAAVATEIAKTLGISKTVIGRGLAKTFWPLRFEIISRNPVIVLDGAHNPDSCRRLSETLCEIFPKRKWILIFGSSDDKDISGMTRALLEKTQDVILTSARHPRALLWNDKEIKKYFRQHSVVITKSVTSACRFSEKIVGARNLIVVAGSIFVAAEAREAFRKRL
jgi:dihydrofolate synthase/folylpolyglutamate synthase